MDPMLAVSDAGSTAVTTYVRKGKKCAAAVRERSEKKM